MITHCGGLGKPLAAELMLARVLFKCKLCLGQVKYFGKGITCDVWIGYAVAELISAKVLLWCKLYVDWVLLLVLLWCQWCVDWVKYVCKGIALV